MLRLERSSGQLEKKSEKTHESYLSTVIADALLSRFGWARSTLLRDLIAIESERRLYRSLKGQFRDSFEILGWYSYFILLVRPTS